MIRCRSTALIAPVLILRLSAAAAEDLLRNGGFEETGQGGFPGWFTVWPPALQQNPEFGGLEGEPHGGKGCASIRTHGPLGYSSYTQRIETPPEGARTARLEGWIRIESKETNAYLLLLFFDPAQEGKEQMLPSARPAEPGVWKRVEIEAAVPPWATKWMVRCGIQGAGKVSFDDVSLTWSKEKLDLVETTLAVGRGKYSIVPGPLAKEPWIGLSVPIPLGGQTPLAIRVRSDPPDAVDRILIQKDRENRPLRVVLKPGFRGKKVRLVAETLVLLRDRPLPDGAGAPLIPAEKIPKDIREHLRAAPGVDAEDPLVKKAAAGLSRKDFGALAADLTRFLRENLKFEGGGNQGARECLRAKQAVCTGYANVAASILIAAGVPARILACTQTEGKLQEHYIVEAWTEKLGWSRIETTMAAFPWADSKNLIVRIVYPDAKRSPFDVPLHVESGGASQAGFDGDPGDGCWQSAETLGRFSLERAEAEALEDAARKAFEGLAGKPIPGSAARSAPEPGAVPALKDRGKRLLEEAGKFGN